MHLPGNIICTYKLFNAIVFCDCDRLKKNKMNLNVFCVALSLLLWVVFALKSNLPDPTTPINKNAGGDGQAPPQQPPEYFLPLDVLRDHFISDTKSDIKPEN